MPAVEFNVECKTVECEHVVVVGSDESLGFWDPRETKIVLSTGPDTYPCWSATAEFPEDSDIEFKFVVVSNGRARWEEKIPNRDVLVSNVPLSLSARFNNSECTTKCVVATSPESTPRSASNSSLEEGDHEAALGIHAPFHEEPGALGGCKTTAAPSAIKENRKRVSFSELRVRGPKEQNQNPKEPALCPSQENKAEETIPREGGHATPHAANKDVAPLEMVAMLPDNGALSNGFSQHISHEGEKEDSSTEAQTGDGRNMAMMDVVDNQCFEGIEFAKFQKMIKEHMQIINPKSQELASCFPLATHISKELTSCFPVNETRDNMSREGGYALSGAVARDAAPSEMAAMLPGSSVFSECISKNISPEDNDENGSSEAQCSEGLEKMLKEPACECHSDHEEDGGSEILRHKTYGSREDRGSPPTVDLAQPCLPSTTIRSSILPQTGMQTPGLPTMARWGPPPVRIPNRSSCTVATATSWGEWFTGFAACYAGGAEEEEARRASKEAQATEEKKMQISKAQRTIDEENVKQKVEIQLMKALETREFAKIFAKVDQSACEVRKRAEYMLARGLKNGNLSIALGTHTQCRGTTDALPSPAVSNPQHVDDEKNAWQETKKKFAKEFAAKGPLQVIQGTVCEDQDKTLEYVKPGKNADSSQPWLNPEPLTEGALSKNAEKMIASGLKDGKLAAAAVEVAAVLGADPACPRNDALPNMAKSADAVTHARLITTSRATDPVSFVRQVCFDQAVQQLEFLVSWGEHKPVVKSVVPNGEAARRGILPGDSITIVNDTTCIGKTRDELVPIFKKRPLVLEVVTAISNDEKMKSIKEHSNVDFTTSGE